MTVAASLRQAVEMLVARLPRDEAQRDARLLLQHATGLSAARLSAEARSPLSPKAQAAFAKLMEGRAKGLSVAHLTGHSEFFGRRFEVGPGDLAPRPDTETLVERALDGRFATLLDLGTGTGVLAITLLDARPQARGLATEYAAENLARARINAKAHGLADRLAFRVSDWFHGVDGRFDLIVSNPPYVSAAAYAALAPEILQGERREALTLGGDGLAAYRAIADGAAGHLCPGGRLLVEIGADQGAAVPAIFRAAGLEEIDLYPDITGKPRVVSARAG